MARRPGRAVSPYTELDVLVDALRAMVAEVIAALPTGAATVIERPELAMRAEGTVTIRLQPSVPHAAAVELTPDHHDTVFVGIGQHGWLEVFFLPSEWAELVPAVRALVHAAAEGRIRERSWVRRGKESGARTELFENNRWRVIGDSGRTHLRRRTGVHEERSAPWVLTDT
ncbi:hypothetical protein [Blastococcus sp. TF02A-35]|uniref:hypothetical protein n=1 Tax=Blastococcus sp. TF02A-35 TaxID=2559612 RepID=UPI0010740271|nr:hypothetical protein [Blastococcus sp. TF02A_35]TFV51642.1 hypothetical protein E4P43_09930 [Blastococcus sp. TF02A_35]